MKRWTVLLMAPLLGMPLGGCTPDFGEAGNAPVLLRIVGISTEEGEDEEQGAFLNSDVLPIFNDNAVVSLEVLPKNPNLAVISVCRTCWSSATRCVTSAATA
jgi:hypothetical protein